MNRFAIALIIALSGSVAADGAAADSSTERGNPKYRKGEFIIRRRTSDTVTSRLLAKAARRSRRPVRIKEIADHAILLTTEAESTDKLAVQGGKDDICSGLRKENRDERKVRALTAAPVLIRPVQCNCNVVRRISRVPNDPLFPQMWGANQSNNTDIDLPEAWNYGTGSANTIVAVIDTGIDYTHSDLRPNMWVNPGEIPGNRIDDDLNGYIDDVHGANTFSGSGDPFDDSGHGTHVAGIIGARGNNSIGISGVNWDIRMIAVKAFDRDGYGSAFNTMKAIDYVTSLKQRGFNIILSNNSWSGFGFDASERDAILRANSAGILFVAAAGNNGLDARYYPAYPTSYTASNIIGVAALQENGTIAPFSNYFSCASDYQCASANVHISAPGSNIISTLPGNTYGRASGTSMAAPYVSGAIALAASANPTYVLSPLTIKGNLLSKAARVNSLVGRLQTGGILNVNALLEMTRCFNASNPLDVNRDGIVSATDRDILLSRINTPISITEGSLSNSTLTQCLTANGRCPIPTRCDYAYDTNRSGNVSASDVLTLINVMNFCAQNPAGISGSFNCMRDNVIPPPIEPTPVPQPTATPRPTVTPGPTAIPLVCCPRAVDVKVNHCLDGNDVAYMLAAKLGKEAKKDVNGDGKFTDADFNLVNSLRYNPGALCSCSRLPLAGNAWCN